MGFLPLILLCGYMVLILIRPMDWWEPLLGYELVNYTAIATFFVALPTVLERYRTVWSNVVQFKLALIFLIAASFSWLSRFWFGGTLMTFQELGKIIFFFALLLMMISNQRNWGIVLWCLLLCVAWLAVHAILQHHTGLGFGDKPPLTRWLDREEGIQVHQAIAFGTFEDPNDLCLILVVAIPLFYVQYKTLDNPAQKAIALAGVGLCSYGAWTTNSRGGVVAIFGMLASYAIVRTKGIRRYLLATAAISIVTVLAPSRFGRGLGGRDRSILWGDGLAMFKDNPLFGVGYKMFSEYASERKVTHNTYVHTLAELGLIGYVPFFLLFYVTLVQLRRAIRYKEILSPKDNLQLAGLFSALSGYFTGVYFLSRQYQHILYLILALAITAVHIICEKHGLREQVTGKQNHDLRWGTLWAVGSVVVIWITIRIVNAIS
ncbi:MAG: hypothetical protein FJ395_22045 [Verrucomicrobia bacterium]|nr:hypothetical protein [Verrucomicrobiota bacterium]